MCPYVYAGRMVVDCASYMIKLQIGQSGQRDEANKCKEKGENVKMYR